MEVLHLAVAVVAGVLGACSVDADDGTYNIPGYVYSPSNYRPIDVAYQTGFLQPAFHDETSLTPKNPGSITAGINPQPIFKPTVAGGTSSDSVCPDVCILLYQPVCACCNGTRTTFGNSCELHREQCKGTRNCVYIRDGECNQCSAS